MAELATIPSLIGDANLKAYYRLESGALTTDSSSNGKTLTNNNTVGEGNGQYGICADFGTSNTNKSLSIVDNLGITGGAVTVAGWFSIRTAIGDGNDWLLIGQEDSTNDILNGIGYNRSGSTRTVTFRRYRQGVAADQVAYNIDLGTDTWYHLAVTYDTTNIRGYLNGVLVGSPIAASGNGTGVTANSFSIGNSRGLATGHAYYASALADDVAVFNRALTANEILSLYNNSSGFLALL